MNPSLYLRIFAAALVFCGAPTSVHATPISKKITSRVTESAIDSSLDALVLPENQRKLAILLSSPALTQSARAITLTIVNAVIDGVHQRISQNADQLAHGFDSKMRDHVAPGAALVARSVVGSALATSLSQENAKRMDLFAEHTAHGFVKGLAVGMQHDLGPSVARVIEYDLGPASASMLEHQIMPAIARGLNSPEMQAAIGATTTSIARNLVRGADAGMDTAQAEKEATGKESNLQLFGTQLAKGYAVVLFFVFALASVLLVLVLLLVRSARRQRQLTEQGKHREEAILAILEQLESEHPSLHNDVRGLIREHFTTSSNVS